jgi:gamma-glutamylcyclotransferase (GGCT)/AIG2-like uncharacterized protein YtfP
MSHHLFSYGSLQNKNVQIASFGRELAGHADALPGYTRRLIPIPDPNVIAALGESHYANAEPSPHREDIVTGTVFEITDQELAAADQYEAPAQYHRIPVTLQPGTQAWVYVYAKSAL